MRSEVVRAYESLPQIQAGSYMDALCNVEFWWNAAAVIGLLYVLNLLVRETWTILSGFCAFFLAPMGISRMNLKKYGKWAVVTGASEGIGKGYALELARQGLNVVIMSRSEEKLQSVAKEIGDKYGREVRIIPVDFTDGQVVYPKIAEELMDLDIGILVNNVALGYEYPEFLANIGEMQLRNFVELNCQTMVQMTRLVLPRMVEKKSGVVVNISSSASNLVLPMDTMYGATKSFVNHFSNALSKEYCSKGIYIQTVIPFFVATSMSGFRKTNFFVPSPISYARAAVTTIGIQRTTLGCFSHALQNFVIQFVPVFIKEKVAWDFLTTKRKKYLKKKSKQQ